MFYVNYTVQIYYIEKCANFSPQPQCLDKVRNFYKMPSINEGYQQDELVKTMGCGDTIARTQFPVQPFVHWKPLFSLLMWDSNQYQSHRAVVTIGQVFYIKMLIRYLKKSKTSIMLVVLVFENMLHIMLVIVTNQKHDHEEVTPCDQ